MDKSCVIQLEFMDIVLKYHFVIVIMILINKSLYLYTGKK